jgi:hypothetical protein
LFVQFRLHLPIPTADLIEEWFQRFQVRNGLNLGISLNTLSKRLKGLSYSELEQFSLDVQRRYLLSLPNGDIRRIVNERLTQWQERFSINIKQD